MIKNKDTKEISKAYKDALPFPHAVIDNFLEEDLAKLVFSELESLDVSNWYFDPHSYQVNKWFMPDLNRLPATTASVLAEFNSKNTLEFLENLTGLNNLIPDPSYLGGGVHVSSSGGKLGIHADFNLHPSSKLHRRLNALLFLNPEWMPEWNGQLQLWDSEMKNCVQKIEPIFNRLVVFNVTDTAYHGVPDTIICPSNIRRLSLALYYYTSDRPESEKAPFHWASWQTPVL